MNNYQRQKVRIVRMNGCFGKPSYILLLDNNIQKRGLSALSALETEFLLCPIRDASGMFGGVELLLFGAGFNHEPPTNRPASCFVRWAAGHAKNKQPPRSCRTGGSIDGHS